MSPVEFYEREVRPRLRVEDVYGDVVQFTGTRGRYWRGPCPFHGGDDPNFSVDTETLTWRCFSQCQRSGSALQFLNDGETPRGDMFVALVRRLADRVGVDTAPLDRPRSPEDLERHEQAARRGTLWERFLDYARGRLQSPDGDRVRAYLTGRGFTAEELLEAGVGVYTSPEDVSAALVGADYAVQDLTAAGLLDGRWRGRLVVPWRDRRGHVGGAVARAVDASEPKYLYSAGLSKADLIAFGLDVALRRHRTHVVLVEGLLDVVLLQARGLLNVAAIGGAGGEFSAARWAALAGGGVTSVTLALDNDEAGRAGVLQAIDTLTKADVEVNVRIVDPVRYGNHKDPDAFVRSTSVEAFVQLVADADPWPVYRGRTLLEGVTPDSPAARRRDAVETVLELVAGLDGFDATDVLTETARRTGYTREDLDVQAEARRRHLRERDAGRRLERALRSAHAAHAEGATPGDVARQLRDVVSEVETTTQPPPPVFSVDRLVRVSRETRLGRPSGWETLDAPEDAGGLGLQFHPGELSLLAARTGHGKTSFLVGLLRNWLTTIPTEEAILFFSLEEPEVRIFHRLVALHTVTTQNMVRSSANEVRDALRGEWPPHKDLETALEALRAVESHLIVVSRPSWTAADVNAHARSLAARRPVAAVVVDYLQRLPSGGRYDRRDLEVSAVARTLKTLAVDVGVPVLAGAQINREAAKTATVPRDQRFEDVEVQKAIRDRRPRLEQLREGGSEQEADLVLGLLNYRADFEEDAGDQSVPDVTPFEVGVLKNRYGAPGRWAALQFEGRYHVLTDPPTWDGSSYRKRP